jgi:hypothetical protein
VIVSGRLAWALEFYYRWLPNTMRRITDITHQCVSQCVMLRSPAIGLLVRFRSARCASRL